MHSKIKKQKVKKVTIKKRHLKRAILALLASEKVVDKHVEKFLQECKRTAIPKKTSSIITVRQLFKSFYAKKHEKLVLNNINFDIHRGDRISLLGNNGAGKSTLIHCLCGLLKQTDGEIKYLYSYTDKPTEKMGIMFQSNTFMPTFTVWDYIDFILKIYDSHISVENVALLMVVLKLDKYINMRPDNLSGGEKQRLNLFLSFLCEPDILVIDEFTNNLDQVTKKRLIKFIYNYVLAKNITLIFVSHDPVEVSELANKIMILHTGSIQQFDTYEKVVKQYKDIYHLLGELA